jgi:flagellar hook-associated protein 1 FlgK
MGTISSALSIISEALDADQEALNIVSNNVANASTTGYTEETSNWEENSSVTINGVSVGQGVTNTGATSVRDKVLNERRDQQQQLASASSTRLTALDSVQSLFTVASSTTTTGDIGNDITSFYNTFSKLEATPTNTSDREAVLSAAKTLAADISGAASSLESQKSSQDESASGVTSQVNALTKSIAQLNQQIMTTSPDSDAGTLEDQREADVNALSKLVGINQITTENNGLAITTTSGALLVSEGTSVDITNGTVDGETHFFAGTTDITSGLTTGGGELGGYLTVRDTDIPSALSSLDTLAYGIETSVNALNNAGTDADGTEGTGTNSSGTTGTGTKALYIFTQPTAVADSAANMSVVMTDSNQISAASFSEGTGGSSNATAMYELASTTSTDLDGETPSNYYSSFVSSLGSTVSEVSTESTTQTASVTQLTSEINSLSGVNLNDEASSLTTIERSYEAASKVFTILDTVMASVLNLGEATTVS